MTKTKEELATSVDHRRAARQAQIEAEQQHGLDLLQRHGREQQRPRFAAVGHVNTKLRRRR